ncbi:CAP domain-containing protein [Geodermatophilus sp. DF01-2]|uniref:CAP domain-containing protein n=1 Tax=Geodermatophilus sp. DF01-2 TaxID=2559610 RepID=UPI0010741A08|nr:CAP domain-containing protein [Geodermatophilus sp. DF01_2]TFV55244.1 CAP domain-containing protein [Geodermatophilus sp. DF01_2]
MIRAPLAAVLTAVAVLLTGCVAVEVPVAATGTAPAPESPPPVDASSAEERIARAIFDRVNAEREARRLAPLEWDEQLADVARGWSAEMARTGQLQHQDLGALLRSGSLSGFRALGENIFTATGPVPAGTIHAGWMRSDDHRVNVLNPGWNRIGIGVHCADDGSVWATQEFGRTVGADRPAIATETPPQEPIVRPEDDGPRCA